MEIILKINPAATRVQRTDTHPRYNNKQYDIEHIIQTLYSHKSSEELNYLEGNRTKVYHIHI